MFIEHVLYVHSLCKEHACSFKVLLFLQYDEDDEQRRVVAAKKRKLDAMEERWRVISIH